MLSALKARYPKATIDYGYFDAARDVFVKSGAREWLVSDASKRVIALSAGSVPRA